MFLDISFLFKDVLPMNYLNLMAIVRAVFKKRGITILEPIFGTITSTLVGNRILMDGLINNKYEQFVQPVSP
jgi:hypothetical protein